MKLGDPVLPSSRDSGAPGDAGWADTFAFSRDQHLRDITLLLQGLVGVSNLNAEIRSLSIRDEIPFTITAQKVKGPIAMAILVAASIDDFAQLTWLRTLSSEISAEVSFNSGPTTPVNVTILLLGA